MYDARAHQPLELGDRLDRDVFVNRSIVCGGTEPTSAVR